VEGFAFDAGQRKDRKIDDGDDRHAEQAWFHHLRRGAFHRPEALGPGKHSPEPVLLLAKPAEAVLNDDDRAVHDQPEVQRAKAHQIPETRFSTIPVIVSSMASGITAAVISAARMFPSSRNSTTMTSSALRADSPRRWR